MQPDRSQQCDKRQHNNQPEKNRDGGKGGWGSGSRRLTGGRTTSSRGTREPTAQQEVAVEVKAGIGGNGDVHHQ